MTAMSIIQQIIDAIFGVRSISQGDVEAILNEKAAGKSLNWRTSIVDLLKLLDIDSSFDARRQLAVELGDTGGYTGTAEENLTLHKRVMQKLAANGGKVPADLL